MVTKENRSDHYYCIGCGGEMSAVLGEKREHHFRHKEAHCSWESYLHKLGKKRFKERFDSQNEFVVQYYVEYSCNKSEKCKFEQLYKDNNNNCNRRELKAHNLKDLYDTCDEEVTYKGYRADLMLSNSKHPEYEPVFIEVSVTHDCEPKKLASGIKIIEIKISNENDVLLPLIEENSLFSRTSPESPYDNNALPPVRFYNFKQNDETIRPLECLAVSKDDKGILRGDVVLYGVNCKNVFCNHKKDSIYEVAIPSEVLIGKQKPDIYVFGILKAISANIDLKHCGVCVNFDHCTLNFQEEIEDKMTGKKRYITRQIPTHQISDNSFLISQANGCPNYSLYLYKLNRLLSKYQKLPFREWKRENP